MTSEQIAIAGLGLMQILTIVNIYYVIRFMKHQVDINEAFHFMLFRKKDGEVRE